MQTQKEIDNFSKAIEMNPNDASAYFNRGVAKSKFKVKDFFK